MYEAIIDLNTGQPTVCISLQNNLDLVLTLGREEGKLELEQVQTLIWALQAAEVQMKSWQPGSPRWHGKGPT